MMPIIKQRKMVQLVLATGERLTEYVNAPCTLPKYIRAINSLNASANVYGVVYLPDGDCEEYARFVAEV
jgi:hypothetical protein